MDKQVDIPTMMRLVYERGLTTLSGGNLSMRDDDDIWITPSGIDKGKLEPEDVVCIKADGTITGKHRPSSEYPFHQAIYARRDDVQVILHAHSPALVAYCIAHKVPDTRILKEAYALCGEIGYAEYVMPGSPQLGEKLATVFSEGYDVVLMENHGVVTVGENLEEAFDRLVFATLIAQISLHTSALGGLIRPDNLQRGKPASIQDNPALAGELEIIRSRAIEKQLFPRRIIRNPGFIIEAQPPYLMAFAVTHTPLDTRTIPEAYTTSGDVPLIKDDASIIRTALSQQQAIIVKNSRVIVRGDTLLQAYDRLEVLEYTARSAVEASRIGGVVPMSTEAIRDLEENYHQYYKGLSG